MGCWRFDLDLCLDADLLEVRSCFLIADFRFVNEECSRVMKGKGDHCFKVMLSASSVQCVSVCGAPGELCGTLSVQ